MDAFLFLRKAGWLAALVSASAAATPSVHLKSGLERVSLLELYTSEGCSSCPPAEAWVGQLAGSSALWREFVPVAFHVNYWDHLGWRDALASKAFTERQRRYASDWGSGTVYTPGFVLDGREWRPRGAWEKTSAPARAGQLEVTWEASTEEATVEFAPGDSARAAKTYEATLVQLGSGIVSNVRRGENAGRTLRHEFVALQSVKLTLTRESSGKFRGVATLSARRDVTASRQALAAWVSLPGENAPVQAAGGWIP